MKISSPPSNTTVQTAFLLIMATVVVASIQQDGPTLTDTVTVKEGIESTGSVTAPSMSMVDYDCVPSNSWCGLSTGATFTSRELEAKPHGVATWTLTEVVARSKSLIFNFLPVTPPSNGCELKTSGQPFVFRVTAPGLATGTSCEFYYPYPNDGRNDRQINYKLGGSGGETFAEATQNYQV
eukprot:PhM_4_TR14681/c2_g1_i3/m.16642